MNTLTEKINSNLKILLNLNKNEVITAGRGTLIEHDDYVQVDNIVEIEYAIYLTFTNLFLLTNNSTYIECDRIHPFSFRSVETSVILDLMIHDIDIALNLVDAPVAQLEAVGARVLSETEDLASARLTFENGCTVMVKASRVAIQKSRKMRIFNKDSYLSLDYIAKTGMLMGFKPGFDRSKIDIQEMAKLEEDQGAYPLFTKYFSIEQLHVASDEPLKNELQSFLLSVRTGREPVVTGSHGLQAIEIAMQIQDKIREQQRLLEASRDSGEAPPDDVPLS